MQSRMMMIGMTVMREMRKRKNETNVAKREGEREAREDKVGKRCFVLKRPCCAGNPWEGAHKGGSATSCYSPQGGPAGHTSHAPRTHIGCTGKSTQSCAIPGRRLNKGTLQGPGSYTGHSGGESALLPQQTKSEGRESGRS